MGSDQLHMTVCDGALSIAFSIGREVAEISDVTLRVFWSPMRLGMRIEVGPGRSATICVVPELVNVHATLCIGIVALDIVGDGCG